MMTEEESRSNAEGLPFPIDIENVLGVQGIPYFLEELMYERFSRNYNTFIFHGNVSDAFPLKVKNETTGETGYTLVSLKLILRYYFGKAFNSQSSKGTIFYYPSSATWKESENYANQIKTNIENHITKEREMQGLYPFNSPPAGHTEAVDKLVSVLSSKLASVIGVVDSAETILNQEDWRNSAANMIASMIRQFGSQDSTTYDKNFSTLVLITNESYKNLHPALRDERVIKPIYVGLPDAQQRKQIFDCNVEGFSLSGAPETAEENGFNYIKSEMEEKIPEETKIELIKNSGGCNLKDIIKFMQGKAARGNIKNLPSSLLEFRRNLIKSQGEGMIELVTPQHGREAVGGLDYVFDILENSVYSHLKASSSLAPAGLLMMGPPGTGKSITAEAMAKECGLTFVNLRIENVFRWFVGSSESRMDHILNLIKNVSPCIVFMDEIDQMGMDRGGFQGDSGVSSRIFKRLLEFMGDDSNNGRVFFVAATNEVTHMDPALKRSGRFDIKIPMIPRGVDSRVSIFNALLNKYRPTMDREGISLDESLDLKKVSSSCKDLVGSDLEFVLKKGLRKASVGEKVLTTAMLEESVNSTVPSVDKEKRTRYIKEALEECNDLESLPPDLLKLKQKKPGPNTDSQEESLGISV